MQTLLAELMEQPQSLYTLLTQVDLKQIAAVQAMMVGRPLLLTGMGASFHASEIAAYQFQTRQPVRVQQAIDLLHYPSPLDPQTLVIYTSQSGDSGEVLPVLEQFSGRYPVVALTNHPDSALGQRAEVTLPLHAGSETTVATKTHLNTMALLSLLAGTDTANLSACGEHIAQLLASPTTAALWCDLFARCQNLYFLGHGPHSVTARHVSMIVAEWHKRPSVAMSIGAFRHGYIETVDDKAGVIIFAPPGETSASALVLAQELTQYGVQVLIVSHGRTRRLEDTPDSEDWPEHFAPLTDMIPAQLTVEVLARQSGQSGFRYIQKVVTRL